MANVTTEVGIYGYLTDITITCRANVTYDDVSGAVNRVESWENTYPFAWRLTLERTVGQPFQMTLAANSSGQRSNVPNGFLINGRWDLSRAP